jgi:hypothetical protein
MDEGWEAGMHVGRARMKEAIRHIVFDRIKINGMCIVVCGTQWQANDKHKLM